MRAKYFTRQLIGGDSRNVGTPALLSRAREWTNLWPDRTGKSQFGARADAGGGWLVNLCWRFADLHEAATAFAFPDVVLAQTTLMFLHLFAKLGEGHFDGAAQIISGADGVKCAGRQRKVQGEGKLTGAFDLFHGAMQLHQIRRVAFQ